MSVALEEPLSVSAEAELLEPDVSLELPDDELDLPSEGDATTEHQSLLAAERDPNDDDSGPAGDEPSEEAAAKPAGKKPTRRRPVKTGKKTGKKAAKSTRAGSKGSRPRKST